jgi:hypothetical protein
MTHERKVQWGAGGVMALCLALSMLLSINLSAIAGRAQLTYTDQAADSDRPEVSLGIAMGAFRGLFVNMLWMRANDMKEEGKFYEAVDLAKAITRLQPRFPRVWVFHAWNLAYNISVQTQTREERWNWVNQGISLLRDQAIPANPNDMLVHKELAWIFFHKIGGYTDDANTFYKRQLAAEWTMVMGPPPPPSTKTQTREAATKVYADWLRQFVDAPRSEQQLIEQRPSVASLMEAVRAQGYDWQTEQQQREFVGRLEIIRHTLRSSRRYLFEKDVGPRTKQVIALLDDKSKAEDWNQLIAFVRRQLLTNAYRMEPERMLRYTEKYGPIDWRVPAAHSLYWAARGVELAAPRQRTETKEDYDFLNTDRVVAQSVQELFRTGELYFDFSAFMQGQYTLWQGVPNPSFAAVYGEILDTMRQRSYKFEGQYNTRGFSFMSAGYENFLIDVVLFFYAREGESATTQEWYRQLREYPEMNLSDPNRYKRFSVPLQEFVVTEIANSASRPSIMINQVNANLNGAFFSGLLAGNDEAFRRQFDQAKLFHRYFFEQQARNNAVDMANFRMEQLDSDFRLAAGNMFVQFIMTMGLDEAESVYRRAPNDLKLFAYDALQEQYRPMIDEEVRQAKASGDEAKARAFDIVFPAPEGLEAHRAEMRRLLESRQRDVEDKSVR